jgi:flagellar biosynthesis chaperone FliJ
MQKGSAFFRLKLRRLRPLVDSARLILEKETLKLGLIRREVGEAQELMKSLQQEYYVWLERVNTMRETGPRNMLPQMEAGLDTLKERCFQAFKSVHMLKQQEKQQVAQVERMRLEVSAKDKVMDRFSSEQKKQAENEANRAMDDLSTLRFKGRQL